MKPSAAAAKSSQLTMESLALPRELYWDGKMEPTSPPTSEELFSINAESIENWLYDNNNNFANEFNDDTLELKPMELELEFPHELINGDDLVVELCGLKEENWIDSKLPSPPHLLDYPAIGAVIYHPNTLIKVQSPFIDPYGGGVADNTNILTELTPPHSPSHSAGSVSPASSPSPQQSTVSSSPSESPINFINVPSQPSSPNSATLAPSNPQNFAIFDCYGSSSGPNSVAPFLPADSNDDIVLKTQIIDAIVENAAKLLPDWSAGDCCDESQSSYTTPSQVDFCSNSCSAASSDDDWSPDFNSSYSSNSASSSPVRFAEVQSSSAAVASATSKAVSAADAAPSMKKRTRPYGRGVEDRKIRKKEQNKNAATRYRQKKKFEMEIVLSEEQELTKRNEELKVTLADREREAKYLRTLIREFYKKKN